MMDKPVLIVLAAFMRSWCEQCKGQCSIGPGRSLESSLMHDVWWMAPASLGAIRPIRAYASPTVGLSSAIGRQPLSLSQTR
jgi:hypothetical protein